jgi:AAA domain
MTTPSKEELIKLANADPTPLPWWVTVLYGDMGTRKTTTACSMVNERGLLLSSDDSWKVLLNPKHKDIYSKLKVIKLSAFSQFDYIDFDGYDTIIWDTLSHSVDTFLDLVYDKADWSGKYRDKLTTTDPELKKLNLETLAPVDYRITRDALRPIFNRLLENTSAHIIFTSQFKEPIPGLSKNSQTRPDISPATFKPIGTRADIIAYTKANGNKFYADVTNNLSQLGKSRIASIQGNMTQEAFVAAYKEYVFS